jgi:hypothetical protein
MRTQRRNRPYVRELGARARQGVEGAGGRHLAVDTVSRRGGQKRAKTGRARRSDRRLRCSDITEIREVWLAAFKQTTFGHESSLLPSIKSLVRSSC